MKQLGQPLSRSATSTHTMEVAEIMESKRCQSKKKEICLASLIPGAPVERPIEGCTIEKGNCGGC